jgi:hypothetical protein
MVRPNTPKPATALHGEPAPKIDRFAGVIDDHNSHSTRALQVAPAGGAAVSALRSTCVMGIDPGVSGAVAFYFADHPNGVIAEDVPIAGGQVDPVALTALIRNFAPTVAMVELVHSMPKQGVASAFNFGMAFGVVRGVIGALQIPLHLATPGKWKKHFRLTSDKEQSRELAIRLFPGSGFQFNRKKHHGRAEAALLARFGAETIALFAEDRQ